MKAITGIVSSKKFMAAFGLALILFLGQFFPAWSQYGDAIQALGVLDWELIARPIYIAIGVQGAADIGKEFGKATNGLKKLQSVVKKAKE